MKKIIIIIAVFVLVFTGCQNEENGDKSGKVSFENYSSPSIRVKNDTGERLIAFKDTLTPSALISGIPAYASAHGLKNDPVLFNNTSTFVLILITEEQYKKNENNLSALNNYEFARLYAFYS